MSVAAGTAWTLHHLYEVPPEARSPGRLMMGYDEDGRWTALAEPGPVIAMSGLLLRELHDGAPDFVSLDCRHPQCWSDKAWELCEHSGDLIRISGDGLRLVYVVGRWLHRDPLVVRVSWPD